MTTQLPKLLMLQELDALLHDLGDATWREKEEALGFAVGGPSHLRSERARIAQSLSPELLGRYEQVRRRYPRAVAALRRGTCLGCFTVRPTVTATHSDRLETCERCGRILFRLEERRQPEAAAKTGGRRGGRGRRARS
jgi:hypothetical protein